MNTLSKRKTAHSSKKAHIGLAANHLLSESKHFANELYEDGLIQLHKAQKNMKGLTHEVSASVREKPIASILIAAGVGFILSSLLRK